MAGKFEYDVFLSHSSNDKARVRPLADKLRDAGLRVWFDKWIIKPGDDIYLAIERGLETSRAQVLCLSPAALGSEWVKLERSTVLFRDPTNADRRFVPLLLADCELPDTLRRYKYVDFREQALAAWEQLLVACRHEGESEPPAVAPKPARKAAKKKRRPAKSPEEPEPLAVLERELTGHKGWVTGVAVSPDGTWAVSGSEDNTARVWDLETGGCRAAMKGHTDELRSVAITLDGRRVLSGAFDSSVRVWDARTGGALAKLDGHLKKVWSVVALSDSARALSGGFDRTLRLWNLDSGKCLKEIRLGELTSNSPFDVFTCAVSRVGAQAVSGHRDGRIRHWNLETGECLATLTGHADIVYSVQITPDDRFAVSGSADRTVKVWNLETGGICVGTLEGHGADVHSVAVSPDGALLASTGFTDDTVRIWDWQAGHCLQVIGIEDSPLAVAFSPDGSRLVVGTAKSTIQVFRLTGVRPAPRAEATRRYVNAKVVLLGEGAVGKTSLAHRLVEDCYVVRDRTHGMNVWPLPLPLTPDAALEREALLWDLAGQEDYRLIHRLFLEETALALLLVNPQTDDPFQRPLPVRSSAPCSGATTRW